MGSYAARTCADGFVGLAAKYGIAAALMLGSLLAVFGAITVGAVALFHFTELRYGTNVAFAALGGGLLVLAAILFVAGWLMLQRHGAGAEARTAIPRRQTDAGRDPRSRAPSPPCMRPKARGPMRRRRCCSAQPLSLPSAGLSSITLDQLHRGLRCGSEQADSTWKRPRACRQHGSRYARHSTASRTNGGRCPLFE